MEEHGEKSSANSSRRNSTQISTPSKTKKSPNTIGKSSTEAIESSNTSSPASSASALMRKSRLRRSPTMKPNKGNY